MMRMMMTGIAINRLYSQQLEKSHQTSPEGVVSYMGAVQAQDFNGAKWSVGLRLPESTDADIERALGTGTIVRTWAVRGTLHFVAGRDIHWLLALVAPHIIKKNSRRYRELGLDARTFDKSNEVLSDALKGGKQLERRALRIFLEENGISTEGQQFPYLLQRASLDRIICQVGMRRNSPVFARLNDWVPEPRIPEWDRGIGELAKRYFTSRGPATLQDFVWWSGLPAGDAKAGLESVKSQFVTETIDGRIYWRSGESPRLPGTSAGAYLLPGYDEYLLSYRDRSASLGRIGGTVQAPANGAPVPTMVSGGRVVGIWRRTLGPRSVAVVPKPFVSLTDAENQAFADASRRYGDFLDMPVTWETLADTQ